MPYSDTYGDIYEPSVAFVSDYHYINVPWGQLTATLHELVPGVTYDVSVAAYDHAGRSSGFAADTSFSTPNDTTAPGQPAAPTAVGSPLVVQVTHTLGLNSGGTYNLERDLDHLNVYIDTVSDFTPGSSNKQGAIAVTSGHLILGIPAIGTFPFPDDTLRYVKVTAVDKAGNESTASPQASVTPGLIDTAQIADLAVTNAQIANATITSAKIVDLEAGKITAGTISAEEIRVEGTSETGSNGIVIDSDGTTASIRSDNFVAGTTGFSINSAGDAEFSDVIVRGTLAGDIEGELSVVDVWDNTIAEIGTVFNDGVANPQVPGFMSSTDLHKAETYTIATRGVIELGSHTNAGQPREGAVHIGEFDFSAGSADLHFSKALTVTLNDQPDFDVLAEWNVPNAIDETQAWFRGYEAATQRWELGNAGLQVDQSDVKAPLMEDATLTDELVGVTPPGSWDQWGTEEIDIAWPSSTPCRVMAWLIGRVEFDGGGGRRDNRVSISFDGGSTWDTPGDFVSNYVDSNDTFGPVSTMWMKSGTPTGNIQVRGEFRTPNGDVNFIDGRIFCLVLGDI